MSDTLNGAVLGLNYTVASLLIHKTALWDCGTLKYHELQIIPNSVPQKHSSCLSLPTQICFFLYAYLTNLCLLYDFEKVYLLCLLIHMKNAEK